MPIEIQMAIWFGVVWTFCRLLDVWWPPHNPALNAALALLASLQCLAGNIRP